MKSKARHCKNAAAERSHHGTAVPIQGEEFQITDSKSPRPVAGTGFQISCDDEDMPVICPTCQILIRRALEIRRTSWRPPT
jgi:hypothetical protein